MHFNVAFTLALLPAIAYAEEKKPVDDIRSALSPPTEGLEARSPVPFGAGVEIREASTRVNPPPGAASPVSVEATATQIIKVGEGGEKFSPDTISAAKGAVIEFQFYEGKYSVASSAFGAPCTNDGNGIFSGVITTDGDAVNKDSFSIKIENEDPTWFFGGVDEQCKSGMVGVINPPKEGAETLAAYKSSAQKASKTDIRGDNVRGGSVNEVAAPPGTSAGSKPKPPMEPAAAAAEKTTAKAGAEPTPKTGGGSQFVVTWGSSVTALFVAVTFGTLL